MCLGTTTSAYATQRQLVSQIANSSGLLRLIGDRREFSPVLIFLWKESKENIC